MLEKARPFRYLEYIKQITASKQLFKMSSIHLESLCTYVQGVPMPLLNDLLDGDNLPTPSPWPKVTITKSPLGPKKFRVILFSLENFCYSIQKTCLEEYFPAKSFTYIFHLDQKIWSQLSSNKSSNLFIKIWNIYLTLYWRI